MIVQAEMDTFNQTPPGSARRERPQEPAEAPAPDAPAISARDLSVYFGDKQVLKRVSLDIGARSVTAIIGPSGCGKSTFLRTLNRMHELVPTARIEGHIQLFGQDIYSRAVEPVLVRRRVGE